MKFFKNRLVIGSICIVFAFCSIFLGIKTTENANKTIEVVKVSDAIKKGTVITDEMLTTAIVGEKNMQNYIKNKTDVVGKYALADFYAEDYILNSKVANELSTIESKLLKLDGSRVAISINIKDFARAVSDKIMSGDIVSCIVTSEMGTKIPLELNYVEVLASTTSTGIDKTADETIEENLKTVTFLVTPYQASILADLDKKAEIHLALVYRGEEKYAKEFLDNQDKAIEESLGTGEITENEEMEVAA
ncbi:MAG: RcpC/CpaB family pilus assembly protein [Oscillospiraceae bacterium]